MSQGLACAGKYEFSSSGILKPVKSLSRGAQGCAAGGDVPGCLDAGLQNCTAKYLSETLALAAEKRKAAAGGFGDPVGGVPPRRGAPANDRNQEFPPRQQSLRFAEEELRSQKGSSAAGSEAGSSGRRSATRRAKDGRTADRPDGAEEAPVQSSDISMKPLGW